MSKVYADAVTATEPNQDLTLGGSGDNVIVTAGATLKTNTVKDSGGNTLWTSNGSGTLSSVNSAFAASNLLLLNTQTVSNQASVNFTSSITGAFADYKLYIFKFYDVNPVTESVYFSFQGSIDGGSNYNAPMTSNNFIAQQREDGGGTTQLIYRTANDQSSGNDYQLLAQSTANGSDESVVGELYLFNPSNTTYVKHFYHTAQHYQDTPGSQNTFTAGYWNTTSDIDAISFKMSSGNMDGVIKLYGMS